MTTGAGRLRTALLATTSLLAVVIAGCTSLADWEVRRQMLDTHYRREVGPRLQDGYRRKTTDPPPLSAPQPAPVGLDRG